jgi:hypothetical protein
MTASASITVRPYQQQDAVDWKSFLVASNNGTLFHDLDFLAYHPSGRFEEHHLVFSQDGEPAALLPAAVLTEPDGRRWLKAPYGASVGGLLLPPGQPALLTLELCDRLKEYARAQGWTGVEMRIGPSFYNRVPNETLSFALSATGFTLVQRWLCLVAVLPSEPEEVMNLIPDAKRRSYMRSVLRKGLDVAQVGLDCADEFYRILEANRSKHAAKPTHTADEFRWLLEHLPDRFRLFVCTLGKRIIGGMVMADLNDRVTYAFHLCHDEQFEEYRPPPVIIFHLMQEYTRRRFRYLDLGPTGTIDMTSGQRTMNSGGAFFKEKLGCVSYCRDTWRWDASRAATLDPS